MELPSKQQRPVKFGVDPNEPWTIRLMHSRWRRWLVVGPVLLAVVVVGMLVRHAKSGLQLQTFSNGAYTYQAAFYPESDIVQLESGWYGLRYCNGATLTALPSSGPVLTECSQIGPSWSEAVRVTVGGGDVPVCSLAGEGVRYMMYVAAEGERHEIMLTDVTSAVRYNDPTLRRIFSSVHVTR